MTAVNELRISRVYTTLYSGDCMYQGIDECDCYVFMTEEGSEITYDKSEVEERVRYKTSGRFKRWEVRDEHS